MPAREPSAESSERLPRFELAVPCVLHALILGVAAFALPWRANWFTVTVGVLALGHAATATFALFGKSAALRASWTLLSFYSLAVLLLVTWAIASSAVYVGALYEGVGSLVAGGLLVVWAVACLLTVPIAFWGLVTAWRPTPTGKRRTLRALFGLSAIFLGSILWLRASPRADRPMREVTPQAFRKAVEDLVRGPSSRTGRDDLRGASLFHTEPSVCPSPVSVERLTLLAAYSDKDGRSRAACLQAETPYGLRSELEREIRRHASEGMPLKLDLVTGLHRLSSASELVDALKLRPGLDGVCSEATCFAPWQLVAMNFFTTNRPVPAVRDASFGFSAKRLGAKLGHGATVDGLVRIETASYVADQAGVHELRRLQPARPPVTRPRAEASVVLAADHILAAQEDSGAFRYTLDPFTGRENTRSVNLPRQAGTTLALCEVADRSARLEGAVARSLALLAEKEYRDDEVSLLSDRADSASLGSTALPLAAFLSCRDLVGPRHDALIARLGRFLLLMQRDDGSFHPSFDPQRWKPEGDHEAMYSAGQAVLALVLLDELLSRADASKLTEPEPIREALSRAMQYYAGPYWRIPLYDFFFLEENWHCLAARAALVARRNDAYERFCLDYVAFKSRLILGPGEADPDLVGGYGFGNLFVPHNTATAGFGEALAAAIAVRRARGLPADDDTVLMKRVMGFLMSAQWDTVSCFACTRDHTVVGGFSEHLASPIIRIDYVQHAMAALGHGARLLGG